jgi:hypothetical protein
MFHSSIANICKCPLCGRTNWQFNNMTDKLWDCEQYIKIYQNKYTEKILQLLAELVEDAERLIIAARESFGNSSHTQSQWIANRDAAYLAINIVLQHAGVTTP